MLLENGLYSYVLNGWVGLKSGILIRVLLEKELYSYMYVKWLGWPEKYKFDQSAPRERALLIYVLNGWVGIKNTN